MDGGVRETTETPTARRSSVTILYLLLPARLAFVGCRLQVPVLSLIGSRTDLRTITLQTRERAVPMDQREERSVGVGDVVWLVVKFETTLLALCFAGNNSVLYTQIYRTVS